MSQEKSKKISIRVSVSVETVDTITALTIIKGVSRSEIIEKAIARYKLSVSPMSIHKRDE